MTYLEQKNIIRMFLSMSPEDQRAFDKVVRLLRRQPPENHGQILDQFEAAMAQVESSKRRRMVNQLISNFGWSM